MTQIDNSTVDSDSNFKPYIADDVKMKEFTPKAILLGAMFGVLFGAASVYLALKAGLTVSGFDTGGGAGHITWTQIFKDDHSRK